MIAKFQFDIARLSSRIPPRSFLCTVFLMSEPRELYDGWQYDFCDPATQTLTSFVVCDDVITLLSSEGKVAQPNLVLEPLSLSDVQFDFSKVLTELLLFVGDVTVSKFIFILFAREGKPVWSVSALTSDFCLSHLEFCAVTGEVLVSSQEPVMNFKVR